MLLRRIPRGIIGARGAPAACLSLCVPQSRTQVNRFVERFPSRRAISSSGFDPLAADGDSAYFLTSVDSYSHSGFSVSGVKLTGAVLLLPERSFVFRISSLDELTPRSLEVLKLIEPPVELLVVGCGRRVGQLPAAAADWLRENGVAADLQATRTACSTFNFMAQEQRSVVAILFPVGSNQTRAE